MPGLAQSSYGCPVCGELFSDGAMATRHVASRYTDLYDSSEDSLVEVGLSRS